MGFFNWAGDQLQNAGSAIANTAKAIPGAAVDAVQASGEYLAENWNDPIQMAGDLGRTGEVFTQGVVQGVASGTAGIVDLGVGGVRYVGAGVTGNGWGGENFQMSNLAGGASQLVTWTEPQNDYERRIMAVGQATGEVGAIVAVGVVTGGAGGVAMAGARGAAAGGRAVMAGQATFGGARAGLSSTAANMASTAGRYSLSTAKALNPVAMNSNLARALTVTEGGLTAIYSRANYLELAEQARAEADLTEGAGQALLDGQISQEQFLGLKLQQSQEELEAIREEISQAQQSGEELSEARQQELLDRLGELEEANDLIESYSGDMSAEEVEELNSQLNEYLPDPQTAAQPAAAAQADATQTAAANAADTSDTPETAVPGNDADAQRERADRDTAAAAQTDAGAEENEAEENEHALSSLGDAWSAVQNVFTTALAAIGAGFLARFLGNGDDQPSSENGGQPTVTGEMNSSAETITASDGREAADPVAELAAQIPANDDMAPVPVRPEADQIRNPEALTA